MRIIKFIKNHWDALFVGIILFFTGYRLFLTLAVNPLNIDELYTLNILNRTNFFEIIKIGNILDNHPPLYHIFMFVYTRVFGISEYIIRIPSVIFFLLSGYITFILAKKLFSASEGVASVIVLVMLLPHPFISQYARGYSLLVFCTVLTFYFLLNILRYKKDNINENIPVSLMFFYIAVSLCCSYAHYFGCIIVFSELLFLFIVFNRKILRDLLVITAVLTILYLPWLLLVSIKQVRTFAPDFLEWINWNVFGNYNIFILFFLICIGLIPVVYDFLKYKNIQTVFYKHTSDFLILFLFLFPYLFVYILHKFGIQCFQSRYLAISIIPFYILIARGLSVLGRKKYILFLLLAVFVISSLKQKRNFMPFLDNSEYAVKYVIDNHNNTAKPILFINEFEMFKNYYKYHCDKYLDQTIANKNVKVINYETGININSDIVMLSRISAHEYIWLVDCSMDSHIEQLRASNYIVVVKSELPQIYLVKNKK